MPEPSKTFATPYQQLGDSEDLVRRIVKSFYEHMAADEPELARTHELDDKGRVAYRSQTRFANFLIEWLGGPARFTPENGHPRLRMRHAHVRIDSAMKDAWLRCMSSALNNCEVEGEVRAFLDDRFRELADFLRNHPD